MERTLMEILADWTTRSCLRRQRDAIGGGLCLERVALMSPPSQYSDTSNFVFVIHIRINFFFSFTLNFLKKQTKIIYIISL